jgi:citrate lyase beta subunit
MPPPLPMTLRDTRNRLFMVLKSSEFAASDPERIAALRSGIADLITEIDVSLNPEPDRTATQRLARFPRVARGIHAANRRNGEG